MRKVYLILSVVMLACIGCQWHLKPSEAVEEASPVAVDRYDRLEALYLTTGDFAALQQMNTGYPMQTRTLIEEVLQLGKVDDAGINAKLLHYFQDSTLQALIADVQKEYADMSDVSEGLQEAFERLGGLIPGLRQPDVYAQISSLDESIVIGDGLLGISLDKYLGSNHPLYLRYGYTEQQRSMMRRDFIVPDCVGFYLVSLYPMSAVADTTRHDRDRYMGRIQWVVNQVVRKPIFSNPFVAEADNYMRQHKEATVDELLSL